MEVKGWKVWDSLANVYTSDAKSIPADVQIIMLYHEYPYRTIQMGEDFYELDGVTLVGKEMPYEEFEKIIELAMNDMDFPE